MLIKYCSHLTIRICANIGYSRTPCLLFKIVSATKGNYKSTRGYMIFLVISKPFIKIALAIQYCIESSRGSTWHTCHTIFFCDFILFFKH